MEFREIPEIVMSHCLVGFCANLIWKRWYFSVLVICISLTCVVFITHTHTHTHMSFAYFKEFLILGNISALSVLLCQYFLLLFGFSFC